MHDLRVSFSSIAEYSGVHPRFEKCLCPGVLFFLTVLMLFCRIDSRGPGVPLVSPGVICTPVFLMSFMFQVMLEFAFETSC